MSFDIKTDPAEIPENGERLNQTVKEVGTGKSYKEDVGEKVEACIVKTVVDNGERRGKELSFPIYAEDVMKYIELRDALGVEARRFEGARGQMPPEEMARDLKGAVGGRFQASVSRVPFETENGKYVRYRQTFFTGADGHSKVKVDPNPTQFQR
jgi:hypothetical protein